MIALRSQPVPHPSIPCIRHKDCLYLTRFYVTRFHVTRLHMTRFYVTQFQVTRFHGTRFHVTRFHVTRFHVTLCSYHTFSYYTVSGHTVTCHTVRPCRTDCGDCTCTANADCVGAGGRDLLTSVHIRAQVEQLQDTFHELSRVLRWTVELKLS
jgi:hypothetical protein